MLADGEKQIVRARLLSFALVLAVCAALAVMLMFWHPLGWFWRLVIGAVVLASFVFVEMKVGKRLRHTVSEEDEIRFDDKVLGLDKEPPKNWYFFP